jgi:GNAT superfamily N-acetyltransferase
MTVEPVAIRSYVPGDLDEVVRIWLEGWQSTGVESADSHEFDELYERAKRELTQGWSLYVAILKNRIVGMLALKPRENCLDQIFVDPPFQRLGIGRALLAFAKQQMPEGMWLRCVMENGRAWQWYEREGFVRGHTAPHSTRPLTNVHYHWEPKSVPIGR